MKRILFFFCLILLVNPVFAAAKTDAQHSEDEHEIVESGHHALSEPVMLEISPEEDDLYDGVEIKPLKKGLAEDEKQQRNSTDVDFIENEDVLPDLPCDDENLKKQVENFIFNKIKDKSTNSVIERRKNMLLVKNMQNFYEVSEEEVQQSKDFNAAASIVYLKVNRRREITHTCMSEKNEVDKFNNIYLIIYPFANYYKVVVTNLLSSIENIDEATFIYSW